VHPATSLGTWLAVAAGSAIGGVFRYALVVSFDQVTKIGPAKGAAAFPYGTLLVNVSGSLLIGAIAGWLVAVDGTDAAWSETRKLFWMAGVCGGFTTFSAFSLQTLGLLQAGNLRLAILYITSSLLGCVLAASLGFLAAR
jgi:CrcB protein